MFSYCFSVLFPDGVLVSSDLICSRFNDRSDLLLSDSKLHIYSDLGLYFYSDHNFVRGFSVSLIAKNKSSAYSLLLDLVPYHFRFRYCISSRFRIS